MEMKPVRRLRNSKTQHTNGECF